MRTQVKQKVKEHFNTQYGKEMLEIHGLKYVKKEIFHARKTYGEGLGDKRQIKYFN